MLGLARGGDAQVQGGAEGIPGVMRLSKPSALPWGYGR
jgi:hypothetical protein